MCILAQVACIIVGYAIICSNNNLKKHPDNENEKDTDEE